MNAYNNRKHEKRRWKQRGLMQAIARDEKQRRAAAQKVGQSLVEAMLNAVATECNNPDCPIHGTKARQNSN
jgi:hypothetical protein